MAYPGSRPAREIKTRVRILIVVSPAMKEMISSGKAGKRKMRKKTSAPLSFVR